MSCFEEKKKKTQNIETKKNEESTKVYRFS